MQRWEYCQIIYDPGTKQISVRQGKEVEKKEILTDTTLFEIIHDLGQSGWEAFSQIRTPDNQFEMWLKRLSRQPQPAEEEKAIESYCHQKLRYISLRKSFEFGKIYRDVSG